MKTLIGLLLLIASSLLLMSSCKKDSLRSSTFCVDIQSYAFDDTEDELNTFMQSICSSSSSCTDSIRIEEVKQFLESQSCVSQVDVICVSCILTLPEQSELAVTFTVNGLDTSKILDISMSDPMTFRAYHD